MSATYASYICPTPRPPRTHSSPAWHVCLHHYCVAPDGPQLNLGLVGFLKTWWRTFLVLVEQGQREEERKVLKDRHVHSYSDIRLHHVHTACPQQCYTSPRCLLCSLLCTLYTGEESLQDNYPHITSHTGRQQPSPWLHPPWLHFVRLSSGTSTSAPLSRTAHGMNRWSPRGASPSRTCGRRDLCRSWTV